MPSFYIKNNPSQNVSCKPLKAPKITGLIWKDRNNNTIKDIFTEEDLIIEIYSVDMDNNQKIDIKIFDYDGKLNPDDELSSYQTTIINNKASLRFRITSNWLNEDYDKALELYCKISYSINNKKVEITLPTNKDKYLLLFEKEIKITIIVEIPHSKETGWGAKGLAGHTAMAIGEKFYDYGPDYNVRNVDEKKYDYDFNKDGDKVDIINLPVSEVGFEFAPGRPWWGEMVASAYNIPANQVTLTQILNFISLPWTQNNIYGEVKKIEFYVNEIQAKKMKDWWANRYNHLKVYSVYPWTGEQCTTTVKTALQHGGIIIPDETQKPSGILKDLKNLVKSTSSKHFNERPIISTIKAESVNWNP